MSRGRNEMENKKKQQKHGNKLHLPGSLTVEAAVVVSMTLIAIASMLLMEFELHDRLAAQNALYTALEYYSYRNPAAESADQICSAANAEYNYILNGHPTVQLSPGLMNYDASCSICSGESETRKMTVHLRTETLLRASVLAELKNAAGKKTEPDTVPDAE